MNAQRRLAVLCAALAEQRTSGSADLLLSVNATAGDSKPRHKTLEELDVQTTLTKVLPADSQEEERMSRMSRTVPTAMFSFVQPLPLREGKLQLVSSEALALLELDPAQAKRPEFAQLMLGVKSWALNYAGHQFGAFVGQLGDGRAISLGEIVTSAGLRWELQLKGAGQTPYSRNSDGRAVLRSSIREFLCSEAMAALGVPTTRALALISSSDTVLRERPETGAIVARLAPSWLRFGSFELPFYRNQPTVIKAMADYVLRYHMPTIKAGDYGAFFDEVVRRTADLLAHWQAIGFCHGVMNTDNMSILGLTLDYGPFAFMNSYDPTYICNDSDDDGRYSFENQPAVGFWNLTRLAAALSPLFDDKGGRLVDGLELYKPRFTTTYVALMTKKLGLRKTLPETDAVLVQELCELLAKCKLDYTQFFMTLSNEVALVVNAQGGRGDHDNLIKSLLIESEFRDAWHTWINKYQKRLQLDGDEMPNVVARMVQANPRFVLRHHIAQEAITAAEGANFQVVQQLLTVLQKPFTRHPGHELWEYPPDDDDGTQSCNARCSCSS